MIFSSEEEQNTTNTDFDSSNQNNIDPQGKIFISQLPNDLGEKDIVAIFGEYGTINNMRIVPASHFQSQKCNHNEQQHTIYIINFICFTSSYHHISFSNWMRICYLCYPCIS